MVRKCSNCGMAGHNSRTCNNNINHHESKSTSCGHPSSISIKLFGVKLGISSSSSSTNSISPPSSSLSSSFAAIKKSFSFDSLSSPSSSTLISNSFASTTGGYLSDGLITRKHHKKKGMAWSEEEHGLFLVGLEKLGKGDWRGISKQFVTTRTPTQVASHAQKYFLRLNNLRTKKTRPSLFDVIVRQTWVTKDESMISNGKLTKSKSSMINFSCSSSSNQDSKSSQCSMPALSSVDQSLFITAPSISSTTHNNAGVNTSSPPAPSLPPPPSVDLELTLGIPPPRNQNKSPASGCLIGGTIAVT